MVQALLYGRNVDRDRKAKARLGLAILAFSMVYRDHRRALVLYAVAPDSHVRAPQRIRAMPSPPHGPIFSTATARCWRPT